MAGILVQSVHLKNKTERTLTFDCVNAAPEAPPSEIEAQQVDPAPYENARYGGVSYTIKGDDNKALAHWILAWRVAMNKVYTEIVGPNETVNWGQINNKVDVHGGPTNDDGGYGFKSVIEVQILQSPVITASLSKAH